MINFLIVDKIIKDALIEDIPNEDITTNSIPSLWKYLISFIASLVHSIFLPVNASISSLFGFTK